MAEFREVRVYVADCYSDPKDHRNDSAEEESVIIERVRGKEPWLATLLRGIETHLSQNEGDKS